MRLAEVATAAATGDPAARYVELEVVAAACVFPSTRVVRPNDGAPWDPADAGVDGPRPDAGVDAQVLDAARVDAAGDAAAADGNQRFLDLDPVGGAACGCGAGAGPDGLALVGLVVAGLARRRRRG